TKVGVGEPLLPAPPSASDSQYPAETLGRRRTLALESILFLLAPVVIRPQGDEKDNQIMATDDCDDNCLQEDGSLCGEGMNGGNGFEALTRVELDIAYSSEKLLNLEILLMLVVDRANDFEAVSMEYKDISDESVLKAFESDILSGILDMEVKELQSFMCLLQTEIIEAHQQVSQNEHFEESAAKAEEKLHDAERSVKKLQDSVADILDQSSTFIRTLALCHCETRTDESEEPDNGHLSSISTKLKPQSLDQQRHVLQMLEKSLARELDFEKKLSDLRYSEEDLKLKLHYAERELYCMEELMEICLERAFEAENAAEILLGTSEELAGRVQVLQLNLNSSQHREHEMRSKLQESLMKIHAEEAAKERLTHAELDLISSKERGASGLKAEDESLLASSEILSLKDKVRTLEEKLRESDAQLRLANASVGTSQQQQSALQSALSQVEKVIEGLKANVLRTESRAEIAEAKYAELSKTNVELNEELFFLQNSESEKTNLLERRCQELHTQLEHAKASVEALEEQQNGLYAAISDMQNMIEKLKTKVSKAESRAESAESKVNLLTESNLELNEELGFLRGRLEYLEMSLQQAEGAKTAIAKDIGIRTKTISDLVKKLALERERLQSQITALTKKNKILAEKCKTKENAHTSLSYNVEALTESSTTGSWKPIAAVPVSEKSAEMTVSAEESSGGDSKIETVRTIEAAHLDPKYLFMAVLIVSIAILTFYQYQQERNHA
ncbi:unnamed protein product, partial [Musa acuminata subsp. burmannicoides]